MPDPFGSLLSALRGLHRAVPELEAFNPFPGDLVAQPVTPFEVPAARLLWAETGLSDGRFGTFRDAVLAAAPHVKCRETYKDTALGPEFMDRFGAFCIVGDCGPFRAPDYAAFVVYMPAGLDYPDHHHPAEEVYLVVACEAEFRQDGAPPRRCRPGDLVFHPSMASRATTTGARPLLALVLWRGDLSTAPALTAPGPRAS